MSCLAYIKKKSDTNTQPQEHPIAKKDKQDSAICCCEWHESDE